MPASSVLLDRRHLLAAGASIVLAGGSTSASDAKAVLTVSGLVRPADPVRRFTIAELEALGTKSVRTRTPWYEKTCEFQGVPLARLADEVGAFGVTARVTALNDYVSEMPVEDFRIYGPILATRRDGAFMPVSDKGPLFVMYPFDQIDTLQHQRFYSRAVWQVNRIEFV